MLNESKPTQWHHVRSNLNASDIATSGAPASDIPPESPWIQVPEFPNCDASEWPIDDELISTSPVSEKELKKKVPEVEQASVQPLVNPAAYSSWIKLLRMSIWILRFCHNLRNKEQRSSGDLSVKELKEAEVYWIKWAQTDRLTVEVESLSKGRPVPRASRIASLDPQLVNEVLRVGGRIYQAELSWGSKTSDYPRSRTRCYMPHRNQLSPKADPRSS